MPDYRSTFSPCVCQPVWQKPDVWPASVRPAWWKNSSRPTPDQRSQPMVEKGGGGGEQQLSGVDCCTNVRLLVQQLCLERGFVFCFLLIGCTRLKTMHTLFSPAPEIYLTNWKFNWAQREGDCCTNCRLLVQQPCPGRSVFFFLHQFTLFSSAI